MRIMAQALCVLLTHSALAEPFDNFEPDATGHSWPNAYLLAYVSDLAYATDGRPELTEELRNLGLSTVVHVEGSSSNVDTQVVVAASDDVVVVAFRGSEAICTPQGMKDWITTDFRFHFRDWQPGDLRAWVHNGFAQGIDVVYARLLERVRKAATGGRPVWLTGHSLGGALAVLAAWRLEADGVKVGGVLVYAAPKVGDQSFTTAFNSSQLASRTRRWVNTTDPVPWLPTDAPELGGGPKHHYVHVGRSDLLKTSGEASVGDSPPQVAFPNLFDHPIGVYVRRLYRNLPESLRQRLPPPRRKLDGQPCTSWRQCESDFCNVVCYSPDSKSLGEACNVEAECRQGACSAALWGAVNGKCVCDADSDCDDNQYCYHGFADIGTNVCKKRLANGTACLKNHQCASGECACNQCIAVNNVSFGGVCKFTAQCRKGKCNAGPCGVPKGKCVCDRDADCDSDEYCDHGVAGIGSNKCNPLRAAGVACDDDRQCRSRECKWFKCR